MRVPLLLALCLLAAATARADTRRVAVIAGANAGCAADAPLRYAEDDAAKIADVLTQLGGVEPGDLQLLRAPRREALRAAIARAGETVAAFRARPDDRTVLLFYYSGHSDGDALLLGGERVGYAELRGWLAATRADVRLAIVDGCRSGSLVGAKGGARAPAFDITLRDDLDASGEVLLTSSAADEIALESREIRGSFFTHHLVSGLRGAADASGDGRVTLAEAYDFAFARTVKASAESGMRQHPTYDYRLSGRGDLVLTEVTRPTAVLELPAGFDRALVVNVRRDQVLAELEAQTSRKVALAPGEYAVRVWSGGAVHAARVSLAAGDRRALAWGELERVAAQAVAVKGRHDDELEGLTPEQQLAYDENVLRVGRRIDVTVSGDGGTTVDTTHEIYLGRYERRISEPEFYRRVGRDDLARTVERRQTKRAALVGAGIGVALVGGVVALVMGVSCDSGFDEHGQLKSCDSTAPMAIGVVSGLAGIGLFLGGMSVNPHPLPPHEMRRLAEEHNDKLRHPKVTTYLGPKGAGLLVGWSF